MVLAVLLFYIAVVFASGIWGAACRYQVAAGLLSTESFDSPRRRTRLSMRYFFFSFWQLLVGLTAHVLIPLSVVESGLRWIPREWMLLIYLLLCLPLAYACLATDMWLTRRCDRRKNAARAALRARMKEKLLQR